MDYNQAKEKLKNAEVNVPERMDKKMIAQINEASLEKRIRGFLADMGIRKGVSMLIGIGVIGLFIDSVYQAIQGNVLLGFAESGMGFYAGITGISNETEIKPYYELEGDIRQYLKNQTDLN